MSKAKRYTVIITDDTKPGDTVKIGGIYYVIDEAKPYTYNGSMRRSTTSTTSRAPRRRGATARA